MKTLTKPVEKTWVDGRGVNGDPGFSNSYDFDFYDGEILDKQGSKNLAINGVITRAKDPTQRIRADFNGVNSYGFVAAHPVMASTTQTLECTVYSRGPTLALQGIITNGVTGGVTQRLTISSNRFVVGYFVGASFVQLGVGVGPDLSVDPQIYHVVFTRNYDGSNTTGVLYINGVPIDTDVTVGAPTVSSADCLIGYLNATYFFDGSFYGPVNMYTVAKDATWVAKRYLEKAKALQFRTTEAIKTNTNPAGQTGGYVGGNSPFEIDSGTFSVDPDIGVTEPIAKVLTCDSAGTVVLDAAYLQNGPQGAAYGTWEFWLKKQETTTLAMWIGDERTPFTTFNGYRLQVDATEALYLSSVAAGVVTNIAVSAPGLAIPTIWSKVTLTRRYDGQWSVYFNHTLMTALVGSNPVTNNTYKTAPYIVLQLGTGDQVALAGEYPSGALGSYSFTKRLGVVAP